MDFAPSQAHTYPDQPSYPHIAIPIDIETDIDGLVDIRFNDGCQLDPSRHGLSTQSAQLNVRPR